MIASKITMEEKNKHGDMFEWENRKKTVDKLHNATRRDKSRYWQKKENLKDTGTGLSNTNKTSHFKITKENSSDKSV